MVITLISLHILSSYMLRVPAFSGLGLLIRGIQESWAVGFHLIMRNHVGAETGGSGYGPHKRGRSRLNVRIEAPVICSSQLSSQLPCVLGNLLEFSGRTDQWGHPARRLSISRTSIMKILALHLPVSTFLPTVLDHQAREHQISSI